MQVSGPIRQKDRGNKEEQKVEEQKQQGIGKWKTKEKMDKKKEPSINSWSLKAGDEPTLGKGLPWVIH